MMTDGRARENRTDAGHVILGSGTNLRVTFLEAAEEEKKDEEDTEYDTEGLA